MNLRSGGYREITCVQFCGVLTPAIPMITLKVIEMMMTTRANRNQIVLCILVAKTLIRQVMNMLGGFLAHDAQPAINLQPLGPLCLPCCGCDVLVIVHISHASPIPADPLLSTHRPACPCQPITIVCHQTTTVGVYPVPPETCKPFPFAG